MPSTGIEKLLIKGGLLNFLLKYYILCLFSFFRFQRFILFFKSAEIFE